jgi:phosphoribosylformimino-5-aminoimidazole carboxamide ribotide isomerase
VVVIPAVDLKGGKCVRLFQGKMDRETVFSDKPEEMAALWQKKGAQIIHVVDLDGAVRRIPQNVEAIQDIVRGVDIPIQLGGGIRDMDTIKFYLDLGVKRVILGTAAQKDPELLQRACDRFPDAVIAGIDARNEYVAVDGWTEETPVSPYELAVKVEKAGVTAIVFTDISRDGMRTGPNLDTTRRMCRTVNISVICAGGVTTIHDIVNLQGLHEPNLWGVITGRAIYEGTLDLTEALQRAAEVNT